MTEISVVLPTYNGEKYIRESLDSIVSQTFSDWELIAVDDCSTDGTLEILHEYAKKDTRIVVVHNQTNQKLPESLNIGFRMAKGRYFTWTSDDNIYHEVAFSHMKEVLDCNKDIALVYAGFNFIDEKKNVIKQYQPMDPLFNFLGDVIGACFMYRSDAVKEIGEYDTDFFCAEDYEYWLRMMSKYHFMKINDVLYDYRLHSQSLTSTKKELIARQTVKTWDRHMDVIVERLKDTPKYLYQFYVNYTLKTDDSVNCIKHIKNVSSFFYNVITHISSDYPSGKCIIFGAGQLGDEALSVLGDKVVAFLDNDPKKIGTYKGKIPVLGFESIKKQEDVTILIAASVRNQYDMICQLENEGIHRYCIWHQMKRKLEVAQ